MIIVDNALKAREEQRKPIRVAILGGGFMSQGLTNQIVNSAPGIDGRPPTDQVKLGMSYHIGS